MLTKVEREINNQARSLAKANNESKYEPGFVCSNGHNALRYTSSGLCISCMQANRKRMTDESIHSAALIAERKQKANHDMAVYRAKNREEYNAYMRNYMAGYRQTQQAEVK